MRALTSSLFFDGRTLRGPTRINLDDNGTVLAIDDEPGSTEHHLIAPGLIDLQMNGWQDINVASADGSDLARLDALLWDEGTSRWLGTIVSAPSQSMARALARLDSNIASAPGMLGIHSEGPFLGGRPGAHDRSAIIDVDLDFLTRLPDSVHLVTLAAEQPGVAEAIELLRRRGVCVSIGHSAPTRAQWTTAVSHGAQMVTHVFNGMSGVHHRDGGLALWALVDEAVTCGLIADGHHVSHDIVKLVFAVKGPHDGVVLVSDSVGWMHPGAVARGVTADAGAAALADGTLAGSTSSLLGCVRRAVVDAGVDLSAALRAATTTPARMLGRADLGVVEVGRVCDIIAVDSSLAIQDRLRGSPAD